MSYLSTKISQELAKWWVPVDEDMPDEPMDCIVLVSYPHGATATTEIALARFGDYCWTELRGVDGYLDLSDVGYIKAWMPCPAEYMIQPVRVMP